HGYINATGHRPLHGHGGLKALAVARFAEKPDLATAKRYLHAGDFYWNSGIFVWRADTILEEMATALPKLARGLRQVGQVLGTSNETQALDRFYKTAESISIDHGALQRSRRVAVIPAPFRWSDVGNWSSLNDVADTDRDG